MTTARVLYGDRTIELDDGVLALRAPSAEVEAPPLRYAAAAAHLVMHPSYAETGHTVSAPGDPASIDAAIDWESTMARRRMLAEQGFAIAEAMDTAQRFEIGWDVARRLIEETGRLHLQHGFIAGAGTDQLSAVIGTTDLVDAVLEQIAIIQDAGGTPIILPMPWLSLNRADPDTYVDVYGNIIAEAEGPLLVHWLGPMFLPALDGYFPGETFERIMAIDPDTVRGAKLSMLDADLERRLRRVLLPRDQVMLTGDDFNFADLIAGDDPAVERYTRLGDAPVALGDFSHALLGIFDGIARPAAAALEALAIGDVARFRSIMEPCQELSRVIFEPPTANYKVGLAMLAWLNGEQETPMLVNHLERERSVDHVLSLVERSSAAGVLRDAPLAAERLSSWLSAHG